MTGNLKLNTDQLLLETKAINDCVDGRMDMWLHYSQMYRFGADYQLPGMELLVRYLLAFVVVWLLTRWLTRKIDPRFSSKKLTLVLTFKILLGSAYGYIFLHQYGGDDTWMINQDSMGELDKLLTRPGDFFEDINLFRLVENNGWKTGLQLFKDKLELALLIKPLALANLVSQGNYYINIIFFSGICFWGHFWLYRLVVQTEPLAKTLAFACIFLYPPTVFWLSGIRADGILFLFFSLTLWQFRQWLKSGGWTPLWWCLVGVGGMLVIRTAFGLLVIPALACWWLVEKKQVSFFRSVLYIYGAGILIFFLSVYWPDPFNGPEQVISRQQSFFALSGSRVPLDSLRPNPISFLQVLPQAGNHVFLRPYPWEAHGFLQYAMIIQNLFIICLVTLIFWFKFPGREILRRNLLFGVLLVFCLSIYLSIGYTIPFPGAIVRYRCIPETCLCLLAGLAALGGRQTDYDYFNVYKKN